MPARLYVLGHRNPDTDAICSAIGYARLLQLQGREDVIAGRLGPLRPETAYLLDRFDVPSPTLVDNVYPKVGDVMTSPAVTARIGESLYEVGQKLEILGMRPLPVVDEDGRLRGMAEARDFARAFFRGLDELVADRAPLNVDNIVRAVGGTVLVHAPERRLSGPVMVAAMALESMQSRIEPDILLVVGDRADAQLAAIEHNVGALIITGDQPVAPRVIEKARERRVTVLTVPHHTYRTVQLINMSTPIEQVMRPDPPSCAADDLIEDVRSILTTVRALPVLDALDRVVGVVTRTDLLRPIRRQVILVDHNERSQAVPGIETAEIVGVIDHHRVADLQTNLPPLMRVEPVGACCTLVARLFAEAHVVVPPDIAGLLAGGIVADTLLFRSPTVTTEDRQQAQELATRAGVDLEELGTAILDIASDVASRTAEELVANDFKGFQINGARFGVSVIETINAAALAERRSELLEALEHRRAYGYWSVLLVIVDVFHERTVVLIAGHAEEVAHAFRAPLQDGHVLELPGVYSRKKQIVPLLGEIDTSSY
jgi:manganese-dependent inorganic pyrophosphatase